MQINLNDQIDSKEIVKRVVQLLKSLRISKAITIRELSKKSSLSEGIIARMEGNKGTVPLDVVLEYGKSLGENVSILLDDTVASNDNETLERMLASIYGLGATDRKKVLEYAQYVSDESKRTGKIKRERVRVQK